MDDRINRQHWLPDQEPILTPTRYKRGDVHLYENDRGGFQLRAGDHILDQYLNHRHIIRQQHRAGIKLYKLWRASWLRTRYARMNFGELPGNFDLESLALAPKEYLDAIRSIHNPKGQQIAHDVCCLEIKAGKRGGMVYLITALDDLAKHFDIEP